MGCQRHNRRRIAGGASPYPKRNHPKQFSKLLGTKTIQLRVGPLLLPIEVHKNVLCEKSDYFNAMLTGGWKETNAKVIDFPEDDFNAFELLVEWCYTNRISMPDERTLYGEVGIRVELYCLAHKLNISPLQDFATNYIIAWAKMTEDCIKSTSPRWIKRIMEALGSLEGLPGPTRYLSRHIEKMFVLASKAKASDLAKARLNLFLSEDPGFWGDFYKGNFGEKRYRKLSKKSDRTTDEELNPASTSCCELHTHPVEKMLECPVFKEIKGSAKYSPDALTIVNFLKREKSMINSIPSSVGVAIVRPRHLDGYAAFHSRLLVHEFNTQAKPFTITQLYMGTRELILMGVFPEVELWPGIRKYCDGMSVEKL